MTRHSTIMRSNSIMPRHTYKKGKSKKIRFTIMDPPTPKIYTDEVHQNHSSSTRIFFIQTPEAKCHTFLELTQPPLQRGEVEKDTTTPMKKSISPSDTLFRTINIQSNHSTVYPRKKQNHIHKVHLHGPSNTKDTDEWSLNSLNFIHVLLIQKA